MIEYQFASTVKNAYLKEIIDLYRYASWWSEECDDTELVLKIINGSHCFLLAIRNDHVIGMGRAISDRAHDAYIQDLTVHPEWRHRGIGHEIVNRLLDRLKRDEIRWIGLIAGRNTKTFYSPMGFDIMDNSTPMLLKNKS
ncbi:MAG: GNAT family N-acetyltransferase [Syntrophales bacterium]|jgi:spermidine synthase|nr:GNAT family N-acetyltransferase [Syntrophales bacterium]NLN60187.1 GNAT family N-acetyltransferase [Deltaproteobacteria bacterium]